MNRKEILSQARKLAQQLVGRQVDINEVEKILAYARRERDLQKTVEVIRRLATQDVLVYSNRTKIYAQAIQQIMGPRLQQAPDTDTGLQLLGWTVRFMRYEAAQENRR